MIGEKAVGIGMKGEIRVGESLRIGMLSSPSTSGKTYEDPCPIQTRRDKRINLLSSRPHAFEITAYH